MNIQIVNEKDELIGEKEKHRVSQKDIFRVCSLWIHNSEGKILLAQRSKVKKNHPGKWSPAVEGTLVIGEQYQTKIITRAYEELGISLSEKEITLGKKVRILSPYNHFNQCFHTTMDNLDIQRDIILNKEEVERVKWFTLKDLEQEFQETPQNFVDALLEFL